MNLPVKPLRRRLQLAVGLSSALAIVVALLLLATITRTTPNVISILLSIAGLIVPLTGLATLIAPLGLQSVAYVLYSFGAIFYYVTGTIFTLHALRVPDRYQTPWLEATLVLFILGQLVMGLSVGLWLGSASALEVFSGVSYITTPLMTTSETKDQFTSTEYRTAPLSIRIPTPSSHTLPVGYIHTHASPTLYPCTTQEDIADETFIEQVIHPPGNEGWGTATWMGTIPPTLQGHEPLSVDLGLPHRDRLQSLGAAALPHSTHQHVVRDFLQKVRGPRTGESLVLSTEWPAASQSPEPINSQVIDASVVQHTQPPAVAPPPPSSPEKPLHASESSLSIYTAMLTTTDLTRRSKKQTLRAANERLFMASISNSLLPPFLKSGRDRARRGWASADHAALPGVSDSSLSVSNTLKPGCSDIPQRATFDRVQLPAAPLEKAASSFASTAMAKSPDRFEHLYQLNHAGYTYGRVVDMTQPPVAFLPVARLAGLGEPSRVPPLLRPCTPVAPKVCVERSTSSELAVALLDLAPVPSPWSGLGAADFGGDLPHTPRTVPVEVSDVVYGTPLPRIRPETPRMLHPIPVLGAECGPERAGWGDTSHTTPPGSPAPVSEGQKASPQSSRASVKRFLSESPKRLKQRWSVSHERGHSNVELSYVRQLQNHSTHRRQQSSVATVVSLGSISPSRRGARLSFTQGAQPAHTTTQRDVSFQVSEKSDQSEYPGEVVGQYDREKWRIIEKLRGV